MPSEPGLTIFQISPSLSYVVAALVGLTCGSFANVLIARMPKGQSVVKPRSRCPNCERPIAWYDNIPLVSFVLLRGKCRHCRKAISARYPMVELITALLFVAATHKSGWNFALIVRDWPLLVSFVAITFIDLDHRIIPDRLSLGGLAWALLWSALFPSAWPTYGWLQSVLGAAIGFAAFYSVAFLYDRISGRSGLGGGDIKLLAMLGAFLGPSGVFATVLISSVLGSLVGIGLALASREKALLRVAIPYGPFLVIGALYYYLLGDVLWLQFTIPT